MVGLVQCRLRPFDNFFEKCSNPRRVTNQPAPDANEVPSIASTRFGVGRPAVQAALLAALLLWTTGCRTMAPLPPIDLSQPGWQIRQGQAVWQTKRNAPEVAGELLVASGSGRKDFLQFTKTPLPFVVAQTAADSWQVEFPAENRRYSGRGEPPSRLGWFQLMRCLRGEVPARDWKFGSSADGRWRLANTVSGELIEGFLASGSPAQP